MKYLIDTHSHLLKEFYKDLEINKIVDMAIDNNVKRIINIPTNLVNINEVIKSIKTYSEVFAAIGIHPLNTRDLKKNNLKVIPLIEKYLDFKKVIAIGEIGFDFYREKDIDLVKLQKINFHDHMKLAEKWQLPVIIHSRNATKTTMEEIKKYPKIKKVIHCFSENTAIMKSYLNIPNTYISFTGIVTFKNAKDVQKAFIECPLEKLMLETDCPFLAPTPYRGKINSPKHIVDICKFGADLKQITFRELQEQTTLNTYRFFKKLY